MTAPTTTHPNVPLPAGAAQGDDWQPATNSHMAYRVVCGQSCGIEGHDLVVFTSAIQWSDGTIDDGHIEAPQVHVDVNWEDGLSRAQARELAVLLLEAAGEIARWAKADAGK